MNKEEKGEFSYIKESFFKWFGLFLVVVSALALYFVVNNIDTILTTFGKYVGILRPVVFGCVIAYVLNPLMELYKDMLEKLFSKKKKVKESTLTGIAITLSLLSGILIIIVLCWLILPQLIDTIINLIENLPEKANQYYKQLNENIKSNEFLADKMQKMALNLTDYLDKQINTELVPWLRSEILPNVNSFAVGLANGLMGFVNVLYNLFIGIIVAIYLLGSKQNFAAKAKKVLYAIFKKNQADSILHYVRISDEIFSGFISGKIVDSTIVGIICFVAMGLFRMPYAMLISVIVAVTNIIPVFGPYIGLIPSALLVFIANPAQTIPFIVLIAILQQIDGNLIGPAILGESTGLSAFWVLFAILFFGGMMGIVGMIIGVPLFALLYRIAGDFINAKLQRKHLAINTEEYENLKTIQLVDNGESEYIYFTENELNAVKIQKKNAKKEKREEWEQKYQKIKEKLQKKKR